MATTFQDLLGSATTVTLAAGAATLASSATVGQQTAAVTFIDGSNDVPQALDVELSFTIANTAPANDKAVYLFAARTMDGTNYEVGPPAISGTAGSFTFTNSPVGTTPLPTDLYFLGAVTVNAALDVRRKTMRFYAPPSAAAFIILNYTGAALTACALQYRARKGDGR